MAKILITGKRGFIGSHLIEYLKSKGYEAIGIDIDIRNKSALATHFRDSEFVIHAAGKVKKGIPHPEDYYPINVLGTKNVAELCIENNSKLIHLSSMATADSDDITVKLYAESKQESEKLVEDFANKHGLKAVILRLCVIYSKENDTGRRGARYPIEKLAFDIESIINSHNFNDYKLIDYSDTRA